MQRRQRRTELRPRATSTLAKFRFLIYAAVDRQTDRQTDIKTDTLVTIHRFSTRGGVKTAKIVFHYVGLLRALYSVERYVTISYTAG